MPLAVVLLSGGLDSATVLAMARHQGFQCHALTVSYGQRHAAEMTAARDIAIALGAAEHRLAKVDLGQFGGSSLTDKDMEVPVEPSDGIPSTYVPARNTVLLSLALAWAEVLNSRDIFIGVNAVDYSGYPDCRPEFIESFESMASLATRLGTEQGTRFKIHAPLINLTKSEIILRGQKLGLDYSKTVSCYSADSEGLACGRCDSCRLRSKGFADAGLDDPTRYQVHANEIRQGHGGP